MSLYYASLTVWFEDPFWVGVCQREADGLTEACRHVFGAMPREQEVYQWLLQEWRHLSFSPGIPSGPRRPERKNPKRRQREAQAVPAGTGTKAQQALQLQREQHKIQRQERRRQRDTAEEERRFQLHRQKKREKRRGH